VKKVLYTFLILFLLVVSAVFSIPKTFAYSEYDPSFMPFQNENQVGQIQNIAVDAIGSYDKATVYVSEGSATGEDYHFILDNGQGDFDYSNGETMADYTTGVVVYWSAITLMWSLNAPDYAPVYEGETAFVTNFDNMISLDNVLSQIKAIDNEDGDISHLIVVTSNEYTPDTITALGTYYIYLSITDSSGNTETMTVSVLVKDVTVPVITGTKTYSQSYTSKKNTSEILASLNVTDNYDTGLTIIIDQDNYSSNYNVPGAYTIIFSSTDTSGNKGTYTVTVNVIDNVNPVFTGPTSVMKGQSEILTTSTIVSGVTVNDAIDGVLTFTIIEDNYTGYGSITGSYTIVLQATDTSGNSSTHTITVTVEDNIPPVFYVDNFFINVADSVLLTRQDIIDLLVASGQLTITTTTNVSFIMNEYEGNETSPGTYALTLATSSADGSSSQTSLAVVVYEELSGDDDIILEPTDDLFTEAWNWLKTPTKADGNIYNGYFIGLGIVVICGIVYFGKKKSKPRYRR